MKFLARVTNTLVEFVVLTVGLLISAPVLIAAERAITLNSGTSTYDFHPASTTTDSGTTWYAWHGYSSGKDQIVARPVTADSQPGKAQTLSHSGATHGPPAIVGETDDSVVVV